MKVHELMTALAQCPKDALVVVDVNLDQCTSDRNVLDISEARLENIGDEVDGDQMWVFIQATGDGVTP